MKRYDTSHTKWKPDGQRIVMLVACAILGSFSFGSVAGAQTRSVRDTATAYGARLNAKGEPADLNPNRINNRLRSRLDTRLSLRIERYRPDNVLDPSVAFAGKPMDNVRVGTETTLSPLSSATPQQTMATSQQQTDDSAQSR